MKRLSLATLLLGASACAFLKPPAVTHIDSDWTSPLDHNLAAAVASFGDTAKSQGWNIKLLWAGARGNAYNLERGPMGEPLRESIGVLYAYEFMNDGKCYLSQVTPAGNEWEVRMAREHVGGGQYGPPHIIGLGPLTTSGTGSTGKEVLCSAADGAKGGVHAGSTTAAAPGETTPNTIAAAADPPAARASSPAVTAPQAYDPQDSLSTLTSAVGPLCRQVVATACTNPNLPAETNRKSFCDQLVVQANRKAAQSDSAKRCSAILRNLKNH